MIEKDNKKIIILERGEGNLEENLFESLIYYNPRHIQYIFNQINIAIKFLYNNNIQFDKLELSDIIYNMKENKPFFKLIPFFLNGVQKKQKLKNSCFQIIKKLINKLYFNQDFTKCKYTSDEDLNNLLLSLANNKLNIKNYLNHKFFIENKAKKQLKDLILFNQYSNSNLKDIYQLNEEYYLIRYKNQDSIKIFKAFPKIFFEYEFDFNIGDECRYSFLKDDILLVICMKYFLFLNINFTEKNISLITKINIIPGLLCRTILELNNHIIIHMYKLKEHDIVHNSLYVYQKNNSNNNIFFQLNLKCIWNNNNIINIAKKDNNSIFILSRENKWKEKLTLSIVKIYGFKTIKKMTLSPKNFSFFWWKDFNKTFCFMINKTIMIHLENIFLIDLPNFDNIYEMKDWDGEWGNKWAYKIYYDKYKKCHFCLVDRNMLSIIELNKKERKIEIIDSIILSHEFPDFLFLMDDFLVVKDELSKNNYYFYK